MIEITVDARALRCGKQVQIVVGDVTTSAGSVNQPLLELISAAHRWFEDPRVGTAATIADLAARENLQVSCVSRLISLAFLAPDIVEMIIDVRQPLTLTAERITNRRRTPPVDWREQRDPLLN